MRLVFVALAIIIVGLGLLAYSGSLDSAEPAVQVRDTDEPDRFEVDSGMTSESEVVSNQTDVGP